MNKTFNSHSSKVRQMTIVGLLSGITIFLGVTGYGFIQLPVARLTIMHIPVIIGALIEGPKVGLAIAFMFGGFSLFQNLMTPNLLSFAFIDPRVSMLPRLLIPLTTYGVYKILKIKNESIRIGASALIGSLTNTIGVMGMLFALYIDKYANAKGTTVEGAKTLIKSLIYTNGVLEAIAASFITVAIVLAIRKSRKI